ncbi:MAG: tetratricopeptide repeat protein [Bacteroidetes bacterium]|nr:tetratricopeptide repeat protein [Bacteroidota bacterium]
MKKFKFGIILVAGIFFANGLFAQSIDEGKKFLYYERFKSAKDVFQKILKATPNNDEAGYLLGQAMIRPDDATNKDLIEAKSLYQTILALAPNSALLMAGIGHIELLEGKAQDARNHFEAAISLSQGKNIAVLNAIGYANGNPNAKTGDAGYAVDKLKQATQLKKGNDPDVLVNLGDAYRKAGDGGNAISSYQNALNVDPKYARANYRMGKLYQSQGRGQESIFMKYYADAIAQDATYAPVYENLYNYFYETDVPRSAEYLEKWLANSDDDPKACFYRAQIKYAQGLFNDAIAKADECIASEGANPYPNLFGIKAYAFDKLKDSANAIKNFEEYFKRQVPEKIGYGDRSRYAINLLKIPGNEAKAGALIDEVVAVDSIESNKVNALKMIAAAYETQKKYREAADWFQKVLAVKKSPTKTDFYYAGYDYFRSGQYDSSINIFNKYTEKFPDDMFGLYMVGKSYASIDSTGAQGLAVEPYQKAIEIGEKTADKSKVKDYLLGAYKYFVEYYYNVKKDQAMSLSYLDKALVLDPADQQLIDNRKFISENNPNAPRRPAQGTKTTKPAGSH